MAAIDTALLDNPIWSALNGVQRALGQGNELAARFANDVSPLAGMAAPTADCFAALKTLIGPGEAVVLFLTEDPSLPESWTAVHRDLMLQMVWSGGDLADAVEPGDGARSLKKADVPEMLALTAMTAPGPFLPRTIEMGNYFGQFQQGRLAAMAGERLHPAGWQEMSAVCTHPEFRGRGLAGLALRRAVQCALVRGDRPFLHVRTSNRTAIRLYERLGFAARRMLHLIVVEPAQTLLR